MGKDDCATGLSLPIFYDFKVVIKIQRKDNEYSCNSIEEMRHLASLGIKYTFIKTVDGVWTWKYKKTERLFLALAELYN